MTFLLWWYLLKYLSTFAKRLLSSICIIEAMAQLGIIYTLPKTNIAPEWMVGILLTFWDGLFSGAISVSFREGIFRLLKSFLPNDRYGPMSNGHQISRGQRWPPTRRCFLAGAFLPCENSQQRSSTPWSSGDQQYHLGWGKILNTNYTGWLIGILLMAYKIIPT